jgi:hypothetical protein
MYKDTNVAAIVTVAAFDISGQASAGTINGAGADAKQDGYGPYACGWITAKLGNITGTPTGQTLTVKLQDSADNSTFADFKDESGSVVQSKVGLSAAGITKLPFVAKNARRYLRAVAVLGFTGGTAPKADVGLVLSLSGPVSAPVADQNV